jgi:isoquinoline 1-oxidoreductase beta subunit
MEAAGGRDERGRRRHQPPLGPEGALRRVRPAAAITPPGEVQLKPRRTVALVGSSPPRTDLPAKVDGTAQFGIDVRLPGQLFAVVRTAPASMATPDR